MAIFKGQNQGQNFTRLYLKNHWEFEDDSNGRVPLNPMRNATNKRRKSLAALVMNSSNQCQDDPLLMPRTSDRNNFGTVGLEKELNWAKLCGLMRRCERPPSKLLDSLWNLSYGRNSDSTMGDLLISLGFLGNEQQTGTKAKTCDC